MRDIKDRYFKVPPLTDAQLVALGLTPRDTTPSHIGPSKSRPGFDIKPRDVCRLSITLWDEDTGEKKRPYGMNGAVATYAIGEAPVVDRAGFNRSVLITKTPHILEVEEEYRGKWLSMAMCWQSESGERGAWSEVESCVVP
jgi:hypothetical protein